MAQPIGSLRAELSAGHAQFASDMKKARNAVETNAKGMAKGMETAKRSFDLSSGSLASFRIKALAAVAASGLLIRQVVKIADEYTLLDNKLKLVTKSQDELQAVQDGLYKQSIRSHSSYSSSVDLYSRFAKATESLGTSQSDLLRITETLNKAMIISGATQQEAQNGIIQLSQGMASGVLRGEEFNSIMENGSRIARMLADYLETDVGGLRQMATEGKITSEIMINAFTAAAQTIDDEFGKMEPTIAQTMTDLKTVFGRLVSDTNKGAEGTKSIALAIGDLAKTIDQNRSGIIELFTTMISLAADVARALGNIGQSLRGWGAVKRGDLGFFEFATMNAEELGKWLDKNDSKVGALNIKLEKARLEWVKWNNLTKQFPSSDPNSEFNTAKAAAAKKYNEILKERNALVKQSESALKASPVVTPTVISPKTAGGKTAKSKATKPDILTEYEKLEILAKDDLERFQNVMEENTEWMETHVFDPLIGDYRELSEVERENAEIKQQVAQVLDDIKTPQEAYIEQVQMLNRLMERGLLTTDQYAKAMEEAKKKISGYAKEDADQMTELQRAIEGWGRDSADALVDFALEGKNSFKDFADAVIKDILRMLVYQNMMKPLFGAASDGSLWSAAIGLGTSILGGISFGGNSSPGYAMSDQGGGYGGISGGYANGGIAHPGKMYEVNERGVPELLSIGNRQFLMMADKMGKVEPIERDEAAGGGVSISVPVNIGGSGKDASQLRYEIEQVCEKWVKNNI